MPTCRPILVLVLALLALLAGCAGAPVRTAEATAPRPEPVEADPYRVEAKGPPRPPDRSELVGVDDVPPGESLTSGLPGGNPRVNQDTSGQAQNETSIIADPSNPLKLVGGWNDYFNVNPGQNTVIGYGWTSDGGATWQSGRVDFSTLPSNQSTGDPAFTADTLGNFYMGILAYSGTASGILVSKSVDGGATWAEPVRLDDGGDKEFLTVDPDTDNIYVVWQNGAAFGSGIYFSRSTDLGASYTPRQVINAGASSGNGAYPAVGPDGEVYVVWGNFGNRLNFDRSLDQGDTWLATDVVIANDIVRPRDPLQGGFRNPEIASIAVDRTNGPDRGRIYVVWPDQRFGDPDIVLSYSDDKGDTWSTPARVNDDVVGNDADQFFPWVTVDDNGHVHVTFLDRRDDPGGLLLAMYLATATDGGIGFGPNIRISDGLYGPSSFGFLGDYTGAAVSSDNRIHPLWPDGRLGDEDVFTKSVSLSDYDEDGILNDGDGNGQYADFRCTGGQSAGCDDNCPGEPNPLQLDTDGDLVGDLCDNCPGELNTDQADIDRDGFGDVCDECPGQVGGDGGDPDSDGVANCVDNCPATPNADQADGDGDGTGDLCDICPASALNDGDVDGVCADVDNCPAVFNPLQADGDGDGAGNLCDVCPEAFDPAQADGDGDGAGDACECQPSDAGDREPAEVDALSATETGVDGIALSWSVSAGSDAYAVSRGVLSALASGLYGSCLDEGLAGTSLDDFDLPAPGDGFFYLAQGESFDCGLGPLGFTSTETLRANGDPGACGGVVVVDRFASAETAVEGTVSGGFADTTASDDVAQSVTEVLSKGGNPSLRYTLLEHHWTVSVAAGSRIELHVEGFRTNSTDGDGFAFEYSTDGGAVWNPVSISALPLSDNDTDLQGTLPASLSGDVLFRVIDTNRSPGGQFFDTVSVDALFVRSVP